MTIRLHTMFLLLAFVSANPHAHAGEPSALRVQLPASAPAPASGRLLVFAESAESALKRAGTGTVTEVDAGPFSPGATAAAMDVAQITPGATIAFDADAIAYPQSIADLPDGEYYMQAVLDVARDDNYAGRGADASDVGVIEKQRRAPDNRIASRLKAFLHFGNMRGSPRRRVSRARFSIPPDDRAVRRERLTADPCRPDS